MTNNIITGQTIKYGDSVSTDLIYPGKYTYQMLSDEEMGTHALEGLDPEFRNIDANGMVIVAGENWGCGSAREQAVKSLKQRGIKAIIAKSISRIYYRNCINEGLLPIICPEAAEIIKTGDEVNINIAEGTILTGNKCYSFPHYPDNIRKIIDAGGLISNVKEEIENSK